MSEDFLQARENDTGRTLRILAHVAKMESERAAAKQNLKALWDADVFLRLRILEQAKQLAHFSEWEKHTQIMREVEKFLNQDNEAIKAQYREWEIATGIVK